VETNRKRCGIGLAATDAALGVLPLGTLKHFAKDIGVPLDLGKAAESIHPGQDGDRPPLSLDHQ
jgi:diacylglycerol kinase family enzyme